MINKTDISFLNSIKWMKSTTTPGEGFDDDFSFNQIKEWQRKVWWKQKWIYGFSTRQHITSTVAPSDVKLYNAKGVVIKSIPWVAMAVSGTDAGTIYEVDINIDNDGGSPTPVTNPAGIYFLYFQVTNGGSYNVGFMTEPIDLQVFHKNVSVIEYTHHENHLGVYFGVTGIKFRLLAEALLLDFAPKTETFDYSDEINNSEIISASVWREWKILVGNTPGIADYNIDLLARAFACSSVRMRGMLISKLSGAQWEPNRDKSYPLAGWALDVKESRPQWGIQHTDASQIIPGFITAYNIKDDLFGGSGSDFVITEKQLT